MSSSLLEQRNPYKGTPPRPSVTARLIAPDGTRHDVELMTDTGCPGAVVISTALMNRVRWARASTVGTNFGMYSGGFIRVAVLDLGWQQDLLGYGSDATIRSARNSHPDFAGIVGLPFLRLFEYGGDADFFWLRKR